MFRFRLIRNLKTVLLLLFFAFIPVAGCILYWANKTGLPQGWREALEQEISKFGAHVEIGSLTYVPLRGFVAGQLRVFAEEERIHEISRFEKVRVSLDYADLAAGTFRLKKIDLDNARLSLPVDPKNPGGESLDFTNLYGTIFMPGERLIEVRDARGRVGGIDVSMTARLLGRDKKKKKPYDEKKDGRRREMIARVLAELKHWNFDPDSRPRIRIALTGDITDKGSLDADFVINAPVVEKRQYRLNRFSAKGRLSGYLLTVDSFSGGDGRGEFGGYADYDLLERNGRFDIESSIDLPRLLKSWLSTPLNLNVAIGGKQQVSAAGDFLLSDEEPPEIHLTGHALCESVMFRSVAFDSLETWFSWQDGSLFLKDLKLKRPDGTAEAKVLSKAGEVRLKLDSTIPAVLMQPFFRGVPLEGIIGNFSEGKDAAIDIHLEGSFNTKNPHLWSYQGNGSLRNMAYKGVPVKSANCSFSLDHDKLDFFDGLVTFDYANYAMREKYAGPATGTAKVGRIRYDRESATVAVEDVVGEIWIAPMLRMFAPKIADDLEKYRFHSPPLLSGFGTIDVTPRERTDLAVSFSSPGLADYEFLGKDITVTAPAAEVSIKGDTVKISGLTAEVFDGPVAGELIHTGKSGLSGEIHWSKLSIAGLSSTYGFNMKGAGEVTGRLEFSILGGDVSTMAGSGLVALENAELFSVPILGPLSPVMSRVLKDKRAGFQKAESAFCTYTIQNGIVRTHDFQTATNSITFAGDGSVDMTEQTIDFTVRLNARGLLGLLTLPLRPFSGLFQFRGTGPIKDTTWENVGFTSPPREQEQILLAPPPKAQVVAEPP